MSAKTPPATGIVRRGVNDGMNVNPVNPTYVMPKAPPPPPPAPSKKD